MNGAEAAPNQKSVDVLHDGEMQSAFAQREQVRLDRQMRQLEPLIRWIEVGSEDFNQMFQTEIDQEGFASESLEAQQVTDV